MHTISSCCTRVLHTFSYTVSTNHKSQLWSPPYAEAKKKEICLVNCCGYDSVPWDLGAWAVAQKIKEEGDECIQAVGHAAKAKGGVSGGTVASGLNLISSSSWSQLQQLANPFYCAPDAGPPAVRRCRLTSG